MQLFFNKTSPFARKARVAVHELDLAGAVAFVEVDPWSEPPALLAVNPLSKVPALVTSDGCVTTESDAICQMLDLLVPEPRLMPTDVARRRDTLTRAALCQGLIDASFICILEERRPEASRWPAWVERQHRAISRTLETVDRDFVLSRDRFDLGDIGLACGLAYLAFRHPALDWRETHARLGVWFDHVAARPSMIATMPSS